MKDEGVLKNEVDKGSDALGTNGYLTGDKKLTSKPMERLGN
jgi:hypothetical protein